MRTSTRRIPWRFSHTATWPTFLSCVRPDRISSPITSSAAVQTFFSPMPAPYPQAGCKFKAAIRGVAGAKSSRRAYVRDMTEYITVGVEDRVEARNGVIKLHGPEGFAGMRRAGRLAAEILDA